MDLLQKLSVLSDAAKYDVACTSSGSSRQNKPGGIGNAASSGICHSFSNDGRCISLLKILMSNCCVYDCAYCVNRISNDVARTSFTSDEIVDLTLSFYRRNYIEGLFLSSAVIKNPDYTMELLVKTLRKLRMENRFNGYIHVKAIPGSDKKLITELGSLADRMSVNIELPSSEGLKLLAPQKKREAIINPMSIIHQKIIENADEKQRFKNTYDFVPAGQSTQMIVGATSDNDLGIIRLSEALYKKYSLKRVFYSAYVPVSDNPLLPAIKSPPLLREHRLYQADWLLRFYRFSASELLNENNPNFNIFLDPKCDWALRNLESFPVEINKAEYDMLLRVPGIGVKSAQRILGARRTQALDFDNLKKLGIVLKRARYFITCKGRYYDRMNMNDKFIEQNLYALESVEIKRTSFKQLSLFEDFRASSKLTSSAAFNDPSLSRNYMQTKMLKGVGP